MNKLIETTFTYDEGLMKDCKRNGVIKTKKAMINVAYIVSVNEWVGKLLHEGRNGTRVIDVNNTEYIDDRPYDEFVKLLK